MKPRTDRITPPAGTRLLVRPEPADSLGVLFEGPQAVRRLCSPGFMEDALSMLHARLITWGRTAEVVCREFSDEWRQRGTPGRLSEPTLRAWMGSMIRACAVIARRLPLGAEAPLAIVASTASPCAPSVAALAELVLRENGQRVLDLGIGVAPDLLRLAALEHEARSALLIATPGPGWPMPTVRLDAAADGMREAGATLWFVGDVAWPVVPGARVCSSLGALGSALGANGSAPAAAVKRA